MSPIFLDNESKGSEKFEQLRGFGVEKYILFREIGKTICIAPNKSQMLAASANWDDCEYEEEYF